MFNFVTIMPSVSTPYKSKILRQNLWTVGTKQYVLVWESWIEFVPPLLLFIALAVAMASVVTRKSQRTKRGLLELAGAIKCSTGRSALAYMMYGCYCGLGGQGWPRDRADWWGTNQGFNHTLLESDRKIQLNVKPAFIFFLKISQI